MALVKLKRGASTGITSVVLESGEPAYTTDTKKLYIGNPDGSKSLINPDTAGASDKLAAARKFGIVGDGTAASVSFDGTNDVTLNFILANTGVSAGTYTKFTVNSKGLITGASTLAAADIPSLTLSKISDAGTAAGKNTGTSSGQIPILDSNGKLNTSILPALAITETFVVSSQSAMLALSGAGVGDIAVRTDLSKSFILKAAPYSTLANWQELLTPTDAVLSVNGKTGAVTLTYSDVSAPPANHASAGTAYGVSSGTQYGHVMASTAVPLMNGTASAGSNTGKFAQEGHVHPADTGREASIPAGTSSQYLNGTKTWTDFQASVRSTVLTGLSTSASAVVTTADNVLASIGKLQAQVSLRAPLASPAFTGTPTAPTAASSADSTQIATTAFVKNQGYLTSNSVIDGGTF